MREVLKFTYAYGYWYGYTHAGRKRVKKRSTKIMPKKLQIAMDAHAWTCST